MSSNSSESNVFEDYHEIEEQLSGSVITFRELIHKITTLDIYSGNEKIPFRERDKEFQRILLSEFTS